MGYSSHNYCLWSSRWNESFEHCAMGERSIRKKQKINVVDDQFRSPTLAEDLAEACLLCAEKSKGDFSRQRKRPDEYS